MKQSGVFKYKADATQKDSSWVPIARVLRTVGLEGWVRVNILTDFPHRFVEGAEFHLQKGNGSFVPCKIDGVREHFRQNFMELKFFDFADCDAASEIVGDYIVIPKSERREVGDQSFYPDEIKNLDLLAPDGTKAGTIKCLEAEVPSPYLVIDSPDYGEVLIPFRKAFFAEISKSGGYLKLSDDLITHVPKE